jgi:hypothetical protein
MDTFPGLVIYTALLALSRSPDLWTSLYSGENMLFSANDFVRPGATRTWNLLGEIADPEVAQAVERLRACCRPGWTADGPTPPRSTPDPGPATAFDGATPTGGYFGQGTTVSEPATQTTPRPPDRTSAAAGAGLGVAAAVLMALLVAVAGGDAAGAVLCAITIGLMVFFVARAVLNQRR